LCWRAPRLHLPHQLRAVCPLDAFRFRLPAPRKRVRIVWSSFEVPLRGGKETAQQRHRLPADTRAAVLPHQLFQCEQPLFQLLGFGFQFLDRLKRQQRQLL